MIDHALAAPVFAAAVRDIGSHRHRGAPVRASNARTTPSDMSTRPLSSIADPTITTSSTTAGGDVMWYSPLR